MGEAKRRKLAGTYPVQDGGSWRLEFLKKPSLMSPAERTEFDTLLDDHLSRPDLFGPLVEAAANLDEDEKDYPGTPFEKARLAVRWLAENGLLGLEVRHGKDHLQVRIVPVMPREPPDAA